MDQPASERHQSHRFYEALGRMVAALDASGLLEDATEYHWWSADFTWKFEWRTGPDPQEVAAKLWRAAADPESPVASALEKRITLDPPRGRSTLAFLRVLDVPVMFRVLEPADPPALELLAAPA